MLPIKKSIGIATWYKSRNYGTCLQAFALYKALKTNGYNSFIIAPFSLNNIIKNTIRNILFSLGIYKLIERNTAIDTQWKNLIQVIHKDMEIVNVATKKQQKKLLQHTKIFITGSDQIWNPNYITPFYLLSFADKAKKISYASSIGVDTIQESQKGIYIKYLSDFASISLRERKGADVISKLLSRNDIQSVVDPTFLLNQNDWTDFSKNAILTDIIQEPYILVYFIGDNDFYPEYVQYVSTKLGISNIIVAQSVENKTFKISNAINYRDAGPKEFIKLLINASAIITDSFHACALSINMSKPFVVLKRFNDTQSSSQNSRIYDLLDEYGLQNCLMDNLEFEIPKIDYPSVQKKVSHNRENSLKFLIDSIES